MKKGKLATFMIAAAVGFFVLCCWYINVFQNIENKYFDSLFGFRGNIKPAPEVVIVGFDEDSFKVLGRWPWSRKTHGEIIERLAAAGAKAIIFDMIMPEPELDKPGSDEYFAQAAKNSGRVVIGSLVAKSDANGNPEEITLPAQALREGSLIGYVNIAPEKDGICRKISLFKMHNNKIMSSLAMQGLQLFFNKSPEQIIAEKKIQIDKYNEILINYTGGYETFPYYSYVKVLNGEIPAEKFAGKIVLLGGTAAGLFDFKATPTSPVFPGVEIHANTISNVINENFLRTWPSSVSFFLIVLFTLITGLISGKMSPFKGGMITLVLLVGMFAGALVLFIKNNTYVELIAPAAALTLSYVGILFYRFMTEEKEKRKIKKTFSQYLSPKIMEKVLNDPSYLKMGGHKENLTVLFSDIRGFTTITESLPPEELVAQLNEYLGKMVEIVFKWDGTMDKFVGDAVMAYWGAPIPQNDHPLRGVLCAIEMHKELKKLQDKWTAEGRQFLFNIGVGVNTGDMIMGNMGSPGKKDFTVIGDNVNLGARLESTTKEYHAKIIISEVTYNAVKEVIDAKHIGSVKVKGKTKGVEIYAVLGKKGEEPISKAEEIHKDEEKHEAPKQPAAPPAAPAKFDPDATVKFTK